MGIHAATMALTVYELATSCLELLQAPKHHGDKGTCHATPSSIDTILQNPPVTDH